jgi:hypothetical protein
MYDAGQLRPVQTGEVVETQAAPQPAATQQAVQQAAEVSALTDADNLHHTPQRRADLQHEVHFGDGPVPAATPATTSPTHEAETTGTTAAPAAAGPAETTEPAQGTDETPAGLQHLDQDIMAMVTDALNACKDQNYKSALDMIDAAIASHRKMLEATERQHRKEAPLIAARQQAEALRQIQAQITQERASQQAADQRRVAP